MDNNELDKIIKEKLNKDIKPSKELLSKDTYNPLERIILKSSK